MVSHPSNGNSTKTMYIDNVEMKLPIDTKKTGSIQGEYLLFGIILERKGWWGRHYMDCCPPDKSYFHLLEPRQKHDLSISPSNVMPINKHCTFPTDISMICVSLFQTEPSYLNPVWLYSHF